MEPRSGPRKSDRPPVRDLERPLIFIALACGLPFALLAVWARLTPLADWERTVLAAVALPPGPYGDLVRAVNMLGDLWVWALIVVALATALVALRAVVAGLLVALTVVGDLVGFAVKLIVERTRPEGAFVEHLFGGDTFAFPSGHVIRATALVAALAWVLAPAQHRLPAALLGGLVAGVGMGYARVALGVHWPSDALGGLLLGLAWFALTAALLAGRLSDAARTPGSRDDPSRDPPLT